MAPSHFYPTPPSTLVQPYSHPHSYSFGHFSLRFMNERREKGENEGERELGGSGVHFVHIKQFLFYEWRWYGLREEEGRWREALGSAAWDGVAMGTAACQEPCLQS